MLKDRLYTAQAGGRPRRSAQTVLWHLAEAMVRWLAPILSFTAEEAYAFLPGATPGRSVFHQRWYEFPAAGSATTIDWPAIVRLKTDVQAELERLRGEGLIGAPLDASVEVWCDRDQVARFSALGEELRFALISSETRVTEVSAPPPGAVPAPTAAQSGVWLTVAPNSNPKCVRCWQRRSDVGSDPGHPLLCARCAINVGGPGETRRFA